MLVAIVSNSCQNEDAIETSSQNDLEYKEKLEKLIKVGKLTDLKTSKIDVSNALKFKNHEEAYNYFKNNREFVSDTITTVLKIVPQPNNMSKTAKLEPHSSSDNPIYGNDTQSNYEVVNDFTEIKNNSFSAGINANYHFNCTVQYAYIKQNNTKNYYAFNVSSSNASSVQVAFSGIGSIRPSGSLSVNGSGTSLRWTKIYQQEVVIGDPESGGYMRNFIIRVEGSVGIRPSYFGSSIGPLTISHFLTASYY